MACVCGCGRKISARAADRNLAAASLALELLVWDKNRVLDGLGPEGREGLIARGTDLYGQLLESLHGETGRDPLAASDEWLRESRAMRAGRSDMTRRRLLGTGAPALSDEDMEHLDRLDPGRSFTGPDRPGARGVASGDDDESSLKRLRALRSEGVLTEEEFIAATTRLGRED
jgi:hypothetical protein